MNPLKRQLIRSIRLLKLPQAKEAWCRIWHEATLPTQLAVGEATKINHPFYCGNPNQIKIGKHCHIGRDCDFSAVGSNYSKSSGKEGRISIGNNVWLTGYTQLYAADSIVVEDDCMIAANVLIVDYSHGYDSIDSSFKDQNFSQIGRVVIGRGSWIGQNVVVLPGVTIGEMSIVGANSVVTKSIPPRCIAVGAPAKVLKIWDDQQAAWKNAND